MYDSRHRNQQSQRSKPQQQDDRSTYYGGQSFRSINPNDQSIYRPALQNSLNANMFFSQSQIPTNIRPINTTNQSSNAYISRRLNEQPQSRVHVNGTAYMPSQNIPIYQSHHYPHQQAHYQTQQSVPYQREFINVRPVFRSQLSQAPVYCNVRVKSQVEERDPTDFKIFCPACHQEYYNSQVEEHIQKHYLYNSDQFKLNTEVTEDSYNEARPVSVQSRSYYPLIEAQQFQTSELDEVNYLNKYKVQTEDKNKKQSTVKLRSAGTQFARPPLQQRTNHTDIYNCFDNMFNDKNQFSMSDVTINNTVLARKRELDDWEKLRSQKQGYTIKGKTN